MELRRRARLQRGIVLALGALSGAVRAGFAAILATGGGLVRGGLGRWSLRCSLRFDPLGTPCLRTRRGSGMRVQR